MLHIMLRYRNGVMISLVFVDPYFDACPAYTIAVSAAVVIPCSGSTLLLVTQNLEVDEKYKRSMVYNYLLHK